MMQTELINPMHPPSSPVSESDLTAWGERIGAEIELPAVIALRGDLGAGKTTLARAIARGAGVEGPVPSPTYNLMFRYQIARGAVVHIDLYRLDDPEEVWDLGWAELPSPSELVLIEWPERAEGLLPTPRWEVEMVEVDGDPDRRVVRIRLVEHRCRDRHPERA